MLWTASADAGKSERLNGCDLGLMWPDLPRSGLIQLQENVRLSKVVYVSDDALQGAIEPEDYLSRVGPRVVKPSG